MQICGFADEMSHSVFSVARWRRFSPLILRGMRSLEKPVIGLWLGLVAASVAVFASAFPYIYAAENEIRCGAFAITNVSLFLISGSLVIAALIYFAFNTTRIFFVYAIYKSSSLVSAIFFMCWIAVVILGVYGFANFLYMTGGVITYDLHFSAVSNSQNCKGLILALRVPSLLW